jgi:hypothetical protein
VIGEFGSTRRAGRGDCGEAGTAARCAHSRATRPSPQCPKHVCPTAFNQLSCTHVTHTHSMRLHSRCTLHGFETVVCRIVLSQFKRNTSSRARSLARLARLSLRGCRSRVPSSLRLKHTRDHGRVSPSSLALSPPHSHSSPHLHMHDRTLRLTLCPRCSRSRSGRPSSREASCAERLLLVYVPLPPLPSHMVMLCSPPWCAGDETWISTDGMCHATDAAAVGVHASERPPTNLPLTSHEV